MVVPDVGRWFYFPPQKNKESMKAGQAIPTAHLESQQFLVQ